jgi:hypothetical protein
MSRCQLFDLAEISGKTGLLNIFVQKRKRLKRIFKRRRRYLVNLFLEFTRQKQTSKDSVKRSSVAEDLKSGDIVRVKSRVEIQNTLNRWNKLKSCSFMEEMWSYCGTTQRVYKRIERFLDERDYLIKKCRGIVILEGIFCEGTKDFGPCDRSCFFFWRQEWLERIK